MMIFRGLNKSSAFLIFALVFSALLYYLVNVTINDERTLIDRQSNSVYNKNYLNVTRASVVTTMGNFGIKFYTGYATTAIANFKLFTEEGLYDKTKFHRVIKDFLIQGGDPFSKDNSQKLLWGTGGPGFYYKTEINELPAIRGSVAMVNNGHNKNGSQFFILTSDTPTIEGKFTIFGYVDSGMDNVDLIENAPTNGDIPIDPVKVDSISLTE